MGVFPINRDINQNLQREELLVLRALVIQESLFTAPYGVAANFACTAV